MAKNCGGPAAESTGEDFAQRVSEQGRRLLRDKFARQALAGLTATNETNGWSAARIAEAAYVAADAMLAEREKRDE